MLVRSIPCAKSSILCDLAKTESQSERAGFLFCENASVSRAVTVETIMILWYD